MEEVSVLNYSSKKCFNPSKYSDKLFDKTFEIVALLR